MTEDKENNRQDIEDVEAQDDDEILDREIGETVQEAVNDTNSQTNNDNIADSESTNNIINMNGNHDEEQKEEKNNVEDHDYSQSESGVHTGDDSTSADYEEDAFDEFALTPTFSDRGYLSSVRPGESNRSVSFESLPAPPTFEESEGSSGEISETPVRPLEEGNSERFLSQRNQRVSLMTDMETGREGGTRAHSALIRKQSQCMPQGSGARRRRGFKNFINKGTKMATGGLFSHIDEEDDDDDDQSNIRISTHGNFMVQHSQVLVLDTPEKDDTTASQQKGQHLETQYRLRSTQADESRGGLGRVFGFAPARNMSEALGDEKTGVKCFGVRPNVMVIKYLNWTFRTSFMAVFVSAALAFFCLTLIFAILIFWSGRNNPACIHVNGVDFGTTGADFMDAYALSWTTFSTVGYGLIYPATSAVKQDIVHCTGITILTTMESFVGILFGSMCGAILFGKVTRIASFAQVTFSDPIVIRFGTGVAAGEGDDEENSSNGDGENNGPVSSGPVMSRLPCPLLEFRVANRLHSQVGGEIIDSTMNIVASIDEKQASRSVRQSANNARRRGGKKGKKRPRRGGRNNLKKSGSENFKKPSHQKMERAKDSVMSLFQSIRERRHQAFDEDPSGKIVPRRIFSKLEIESPEHPFFKRVWLARHVLDQHSPLLKHEARELVRLNNGHWPHELNNAEAVRASIHFDQILVSLSGTSNVDANSVYAQKVYDFVDVCVGYRFCNILFRGDDGSLGVDLDLLNDVTEQAGGGAESLDVRQDSSLMNEILFL